MSRRKQSNPKPIKHEEDSEEGTDRRSGHAPGAQNDMATASPDETNDSTGHESRDSDCHTNDLQEYPLKAEVLSNDLDIAARQGSHCNHQGSGEEDSTSHEKRLKECCSSHLSEMLSDSNTRINSSSDNGPAHTSTDHLDLPKNIIEPIIKRELSASPNNEGRGDSDEGPVHHGHSVTPSYKLSNKSKRRNRSRSRSSSKSVGVPCSPDAPPTSSQSREEAERALVNQLQLPSDVLYLRQQEMTIQGIPSIGWVVCCAIPLPQGSSLGPFQGQLVPPDAVKVGDLIVQFTNKKGQQALMNVAGETGGWLALLRSPAKTERNTHVYWEGGRIWCEVVADIEIGTELRATFSFQSDDDNEDDGDEEAASTSEAKQTEGSSSEETAASVQQIQHPYQQQVAPGHAALIYGCPFCGVRFSSPRTLQGHLSFYCSKKTSDHMVTPVSKDRDKGVNQSRPQLEDVPLKQEPGLRQDAESPPGTQAPTDSDSQAELDAPSSASQAKVGRPGQVFKCKHCSYKADKLSSLNRHMRMHNNDKVRVISFSPGERVPCSMSENLSASTRSPNSETFCKECKIQFSNLHTFKCHKEHYCTQRRKKALADPSAFAAMFHSPFSFHDPSKVGVPSALQMAALNQGGLILPQSSHDASGQASTSLLLSTPVLTASGVASIAISLPTMLVPPMVGGQDVAAMATSPRSKGSGDGKQPSLPSSQHSSHHLPLTHFLNISSTSQSDYTRTLGELHKSKEFIAPKLDSLEEEHPLDLTTTRKRPEPDARKEEIQTFYSFLQPDRDGALDARRLCSPSQTCGSSGAGLQPRDLKDNPNCPSHSPGLYGLSKNDPVEVKREAHSTGPLAAQQTVRSDHLPTSSMIVQLLPHPSILVSPAGFLSVPLTLSPPDKRSAPLSPSGSANGISKCADCNIVFYKHDNYVIHKKHYCSGKRRVGPQVASTADSEFLAAETDTKPEPDIPQPQSPPLSQSPPFKCNQDVKNEFASSADTLPDLKSSPHKHSSEVKYKFYCVPCRIKFSNSSILEAHKEYYCPAGKDSEQSVIVQTSSTEAIPVASPKDDREHTSPDSPAEEFTCPRCSSIFVSARLLRLHVCDGGFPCPHCDHVSITENRLAEHLKVHAPTKAYRCTICGYRGNTARGMRMHGKSHIDEGLDFTDENMLAYHEPALIPVDHSPYPGAASDTELLRLKNEPYKRRRSRKAYEKFDYPLPKVDIPQTCPLCGQNFASADHLASHFKVHEIAASQYITGLLKCIQCGFIGKSLESLRSHYESHHRANSRNKRPRLSSPDSEDQSNSRRSTSPGAWRSPRQSASDHNEGPASTTDKKPSLKESQKNTECDPHSFGDDEPQQVGSSAQQVTIKNEPTDEEKHDLDSACKLDSVCKLDSACKLNHFLQTPNQSPLSDSPNDLDTKEQSSSPSASSSMAWSASLSNSTQQEDHQPVCADDGRSSSDTSKMETEPGEINTAGIKHEPRYEDEQMDLGAHFYPLNDKDPKLDSSSVQKADQFDLDAGAASNKPYIKQEKVSADLPRSSFPSPYVARRDAGSPISAMTTPNFLVRSPPNKSSSHSPVKQSANGRPPSSSSFQTSKSSAATSSLTAIFPLHSVQGQTISFPCTTPQLSLPYLFLPPIQATSSVPMPCSPSLPDDRISGARYCQNCDISFSKHATYLAHKKYYCTARPRGEVQSSAKA